MSLETVTGKIDGILWAVVLAISGILWAVAGFPLSTEVIVFGCIVIACVLFGGWSKKGASVSGLFIPCRLLAPNGPAAIGPACPLSEDERTNPGCGPRSQFDPKRHFPTAE